MTVSQSENVRPADGGPTQSEVGASRGPNGGIRFTTFLTARGRTILAGVGLEGYRGQGFEVGQAFGSTGDKEAEANALLWAASPDLLRVLLLEQEWEACTDGPAQVAFEIRYGLRGTGTLVPSWLTSLRDAAIAKATGGAA